MHAIERDLTTIHQLRIKAKGADRIAVQQQAAALFKAATLQPRSLPPGAILYIRCLRDPLPGGLYPHRRGWRPAAAWEQAVIAALDQAVQRAARPALQMAPAGADAVLFWDGAEWLAGLARDWCSGLLTVHWWWRTFLQGRDPARAVLSAWRDAPQDAPGALAQLAAHRQARTFVQALPAGWAQALLARMLHCYGLYALHMALSAESRPAAGGAGGEGAARGPGEHPGRQPPPHGWSSPAPSAPPWLAWTAGVPMDDLPLDQQCLLGVGLALHQAPAAARSQGFAQALQAWRRDHQGAERAADGPGARLPARAQPATGGHMPAHATGAAGGEVQEHAPLPMVRAAPLPSAGQGADAQGQERQAPAPAYGVAPAHGSTPPGGEDGGAPDGPPAQETGAAQAAPAVDPLPVSRGRWAEGAQPAMTQAIDTAFGGLFYLINLGIHLGYYADFTTPLTPGIELSIYDFVALVGERLIGAELHSDRVWPLLAQLAGRSAGQPPGFGFAPPAACPLDAWLDAQMLQIRLRLVAALDLAGEPEALPGLLCRQPAHVVVSATRLDIHLPLASLPIQIRLSGLDRNPGWTPAAGRTVTFYFE